MANVRGRFTKAFIEGIHAPEKGQVFYADTEERGLLLCIGKTGRKVFQLRKKFAGKAVRVTLGNWPDLTVENARTLARSAKAQMEFEGRNPNDVKRQKQVEAKAEITFAELFARFMRQHVQVCRSKRTATDYEANYQNHVDAVLGNRRISSISRDDVARLIGDITASGRHIMANRVLALISSVFSRAVEWGLSVANPCAGIRKNPEQARERFLNGAELQQLFEALEAEQHEAFRDFFTVALLTGARRSNVLTMKWADIDLSAAVWRIPRTKNGTSQTVPLVPAVVEVLQRRLDAKLKDERLSPFVFPGHGKTGHLASPKSAWKRICERAGLEGVRIHDLRRTFGSWQAITGASLPVIGKSLNHKSMSATAIYARLDLDPVRASMEKAAQSMLGFRGAIVHTFPEKAVGE